MFAAPLTSTGEVTCTALGCTCPTLPAKENLEFKLISNVATKPNNVYWAFRMWESCQDGESCEPINTNAWDLEECNRFKVYEDGELQVAKESFNGIVRNNLNTTLSLTLLLDFSGSVRPQFDDVIAAVANFVSTLREKSMSTSSTGELNDFIRTEVGLYAFHGREELIELAGYTLDLEGLAVSLRYYIS